MLAQGVNAGLERCGLPCDPHGVLAEHHGWRMTLSQWKAVFEDCLDGKDIERMASASVAFDYRQIAGELYVDKVLTDVLPPGAGPQGLLERPRQAGDQGEAAASFRGKLEGSIDIKKNGLVPIQNFARYYAFASSITTASTLERSSPSARSVAMTSFPSAPCARRSSACSTCSFAITPIACATSAPSTTSSRPGRCRRSPGRACRRRCARSSPRRSGSGRSRRRARRSFYPPPRRSHRKWS